MNEYGSMNNCDRMNKYDRMNKWMNMDERKVMLPSLIHRAKFRVENCDLGDLHTALISTQGVLYTFGDNSKG